MTISLIVAAANNNAIGKEGGMPWHLPNDLRHFKNLTWGIPLAGRKNIVISRQQGWSAPGAVVVKSIEDALFVAREADMKEVMVIGGGEIYKSLFDRAKRIYLTRVEAEPDADTFFPVIDPQQWHLMSQKNHEADEKNAYNYSFQVWERLN